jgi:hypothetical protein
MLLMVQEIYETNRKRENFYKDTVQDITFVLVVACIVYLMAKIAEIYRNREKTEPDKFCRACWN